MKHIAFSDACQLWEADKRRYVKASSMAAYSLTVRKHLLPRFRYVDDVTSDYVQRLVDNGIKNGMDPSTLKGILVVLKMILHYCEKMGWIEDYKLEVRFPARQRRKNTASSLPMNEEKKILEYLSANPTLMNIGLLICFFCGLRIGEVCALKWGDVDFPNRIIHVCRTVYRLYDVDNYDSRSRLVLGPPKTPTSFREVPITGVLLQLLAEKCSGKSPEDFILSGTGRPADPQTFRYNFRRVTNVLGLPPRRVHSLRHTFATRCVESQCDYKTLSTLLGHSNINTTLNLYVHSDMERKRRCVENMIKIL